MVYSNSIAGRVAAEASEAGRFISWADVQERMVEAYGFHLRMPDRERGWLKIGISPIWRGYVLTEKEARHLYQIDSEDYHRDALPKQPGLTVAEVARMEEAESWLAYVVERDRKMVGMVLDQLQRSDRPSWVRIARALGADVTPDALSRRYEAAIGTICRALNARISGTCVGASEKSTGA